MAVPKRAQAPDDVLSEAGQQQADADQHAKGRDKSDHGRGERWWWHRSKIRHCHIGLAHDEHLQTIQLVWEMSKKIRAVVLLGGSLSV